MKRALCLAALLFTFTLATPSPSAACYDSCSPGECRTCETGLDVTYAVCIQTAPCQCITYFVPSYQCTGLTAASEGTEPIFLEPVANKTPARPAAVADLSFLAPAP